MAAASHFADVRCALGYDIDDSYLRRTAASARMRGVAEALELKHVDFFEVDWRAAFAQQPTPILVIGNPPWATTAKLSILRSTNVPEKSNFQQHRGLDALTGKSNFDIAEWMTLNLLRSLAGLRATLAFLLKTAVARRVLAFAWKSGWAISRPAIYLFDAKRYFGISAEGCLLVCETNGAPSNDECPVYDLAAPAVRVQTIGLRGDTLVADIDMFTRLDRLRNEDESARAYRWRSGVKHDCAKVFELKVTPLGLVNGCGQRVDLEDAYLYPLLKGSDVANQRRHVGERYLIVTQRHPGEETNKISDLAPKTWKYLCAHGDSLDKRASSIYRNRPRFSIFGVGEYTFSPWKVAVCGLYKRLSFSSIGPHEGRPVVLDDTCYFVPCSTAEEAALLAELLNSPMAADFYRAFLFWDAKRPITVELLKRLNLRLLARESGREDQLPSASDVAARKQQGTLFPD